MTSEQSTTYNIQECPRCGSAKVYRSSPTKIWEKCLSPIGIQPYECRHYTCQHRFYRIGKQSVPKERLDTSTLSKRLYQKDRYEINDNRHLVDPDLIANLYEPTTEPSEKTEKDKLSANLANNIPQYDFRDFACVKSRKFLTLTWSEHGRQQIQTIPSEKKNGYPNRVKIGRNPSRCDLVLVDKTVSGLNAEIYFDDSSENFYIRNLRPVNSPFINDRKVETSARLESGAILYLGRVAIAIAIESDYYDLDPTILVNRHQDPARNNPSC
jgi:FHA domain